MEFEITLVGPAATGSDQYGTTSSTVGASEVADHLYQLGLNFRQSDQWIDGKVFIVIEPVKLDAEAKVRELQDKLDSIQGILS